MLSAIRVRPSTTQVLGPLKAKSLNHTPTPAVNPDLSETDGWQAYEHDQAGFLNLPYSLSTEASGDILFRSLLTWRGEQFICLIILD